MLHKATIRRHRKKRVSTTERVSGSKAIKHLCSTSINMGRGRKGVVEQKAQKRKRCEQLRSADRLMTVGRLSVKPTYVDIPNAIVDAMKRMDPQEVANIFFSKEM